VVGIQPDGRLALIGAVALGVVWGWWAAPLSERGIVGIAVAAAALGVQSLESVSLSNFASVGHLLGGWLLGFSLHHVLRTAFRGHLGTTS